MMKAQRRSPFKQKFGFRRRSPTADEEDEDLLSLQSSDKEPLHQLVQIENASSSKGFSRFVPPNFKMSRLAVLRSNRSSVVPKKNASSPNRGTDSTPNSEGGKSDASEQDDYDNKNSKKETLKSSKSQNGINGCSKGNSQISKSNHSFQRDFDRIVKAASALDAAGNTYFDRGNYSDALASYTKALQLKRQTLQLGVDPESENAQQLLTSVATSINNIGYLRQRSGAKSDEIMAAYQDSLQIKKEILGDTDLSVGKTLNNIGSVYFGARNYQDAMTAYMEAKGIMEQALGENHLDVATVYSNIGDVYLAQKQLDGAHENYAASLGIRWDVLDEHHPKVVRLLEKIAAIEMSDTPLKMQQIQILDDEEEKADAPVRQELVELRKQVKEDVTYVDNVKRQMALQMIRDKIQLIREMRELNGVDKSSDQQPPMSPQERHAAISAIKQRVERMKRRKSKSKVDSGGDDVSIDGLSLGSKVSSP
jgi:tetratricopeptide (TPR) repeat protein